MKILVVASEVVPFAKTGGLADVAGALPLALEGLKQEIIVVMPQYRSLKGKNHTKIGENIKVYFIKHPKDKRCNYALSFGGSYICNCPTRREIYRRYGV